MKPRHSTTLFLLCCLTFSKAHTQSLFKNPAVGIQGHFGSFITNQPKALYLRDSYSYFGELYVQQQTDGRNAWQVANGLPQVGMAIFFGNSGSKQYLGNMAGVFPYVNWRLYQTRTFRSGLRAGVGLGWIEKPYNKITNHKNVLIGTHGNSYISFMWQNEVQLFSKLRLTAGVSFSHFSNGSSSLPNLGLNIPALALGLRYGLSKMPVTVPHITDTLIKKTTVTLLASAGIKQGPWIEGKRYVANVVQVEWNRRFHLNGSYNFGAVLFYDRSLEINPDGFLDQKRAGSKLQAGVFAGYEHLLGRLSIPLQVGAYVYNHNIYTSLFQQLGLRYRINTHWSTQLAMKTHAGKADFIHLGLGYRIL